VKKTNRPTLAAGGNLHFSPSIDGQPFAEFRYKTLQAMERAKAKIEVVEREFADIFGRSYGGMVDTYRTEDAEIVILTAGSCAGTARVVIDQAREEGSRSAWRGYGCSGLFRGKNFARSLTAKKWS
jgi:hypothetical protein